MAYRKDMKCLAMGQSGYIEIAKSYHSLLTSYSLTRNFNVLKSNSNGLFLNTGNGYGNYNNYDSNSGYRWKKLSNDIVMDYPIHELSLGLQVNKSMLIYLIQQMVQFGFQQPIHIKFYDSNAQITFDFEKVFITNFSFNISNDAVATISLSGKILEKDFTFEINDQQLSSSASNQYVVTKLKGETLMPYYKWSFDYSLFKNISNEYKIDIMEFSINYSHNLNTKFICGACSQAMPPVKLIYSVPTLTFQCNYVMFFPENTSLQYLNDFLNNSEIFQISDNNDGIQNVNIIYDKKTYLTLTNCFIDSITPVVGQKSSVNTFSISGNCYGKISSEIGSDYGYY